MSVNRRRRLLTVGHSYCISLNRRLAHEIAATGEWEVTAVGPARFRGDFGWNVLEPDAAEACRVIPVPVHISRPVHLMIYGRQLKALLQQQPWDLVHCWEEPYVAAAGQVALATPSAVPIVFATFQNIEKRYPPPFRWIEQYALARAAGIVAFGRTAHEVVVERAPLGTPVQVISPGVDVRRFHADAGAQARIRRQYGWSDRTPIVGFLGRLVSEKGCALLTRALDRLGVPWRALFVGAGPLEADLRHWALRHPGRVRIESGLGHEQVAEYLNAMDVLCAPSQTTASWREQFGRMIVEAFACGTPVIASDSGELPHVVADAGLLVPEGNEAKWARAITTLLTDERLRDELRRRGQQRAVEHFAWPSIARQHLQFFDQILSGPGCSQLGSHGALRSA
jgi:glycosyltransferase involved in cell wall biosynthesis